MPSLFLPLWSLRSLRTDSMGGVRGMEKEEYENLIEKPNPSLLILAHHHSHVLSQNTSNNSRGPRAPLHCSKCHHPVWGHKRENISVTKCNYCSSNTCTSSSISTQCSCHWHQQRQRRPFLPELAAKTPLQQVQSLTVIANTMMLVSGFCQIIYPN